MSFINETRETLMTCISLTGGDSISPPPSLVVPPHNLTFSDVATASHVYHELPWKHPESSLLLWKKERTICETPLTSTSPVIQEEQQKQIAHRRVASNDWEWESGSTECVYLLCNIRYLVIILKATRHHNKWFTRCKMNHKTCDSGVKQPLCWCPLCSEQA